MLSSYKFRSQTQFISHLKSPYVKRQPRIVERAHRINEDILAPEVRLVGMDDESLNGVFPLAKALSMAEALELDLIEVASQVVPPVCRIAEYSKFVYEQRKREKAQKAKQVVVVLKEIRFGPNTDDHDFDFKLKHARGFLEEGNKIKAYVQFQGRNIVYKDRGANILQRFVEALGELAKVEMEPQMEGRRMIMIIAPRKK